jgi:DHA2 family multidrug resistance protein
VQRYVDQLPDGGHSDKLDARLLMVTAVCVLEPVMAALDATVVNVAQRTFIGVFSSTPAVVAWTMTAYTLALAAVIPLAGWAANRFGTKRLLLGSVTMFTLASLLCALAPNIALLVLFRALQGAGGGLLTPLTLTILAQEAGPTRLGRVLTIAGVPMLTAPIFGPVLGGWLIDSFGWRWIFLINIPVGAVMLALAAFVLSENPPSCNEPFDFVGMLLLSPGLTAFLYGVSLIPSRGSVDDAHVLLPMILGVALMAAFGWHAVGCAENPLIDLRLLADRAVASANATRFIFAVAFFGTCLVFPAYFQQVLGETPAQSGLSLIPQTVSAAAFTPLVGRLMERRGPREVVLAGTALMVLGLTMFAYATSRHGSPHGLLMSGLALFGMGSAGLLIPVSWVAVHGLRDGQVAHGSTLFHVNHYAAAAAGTAVLSVLLTSGLSSTHLSTQPAGDSSQAYTAVFVVAALLIASAVVPALFLPATGSNQHSMLEPADEAASRLAG